MEKFIEEKRIESINILIVFLLGLAAALFILGSIQTFNIYGGTQTLLIVSTIVLYLIAVIAFLYPRKIKTPIEIEPEIIEKEVVREVEKPVVKEVVKYKDKPVVKEVVKEVVTPVFVEKNKPKKSKFVGSSYNEKYHLRTCRFAGAIKKKYLVEEDQKKYFKLRGFAPCKICNPDKNYNEFISKRKRICEFAS